MINNREKESSGVMESNGSGDFLGSLLEANNNRDASKRLLMQDMVDECKTFYFAGHETTTSLLGWTILLLSTNKEWQEKARNEVVELFGQANPTSDGIPKLKNEWNPKLQRIPIVIYLINPYYLQPTSEKMSLMFILM